MILQMLRLPLARERKSLHLAVWGDFLFCRHNPLPPTLITAPSKHSFNKTIFRVKKQHVKNNTLSAEKEKRRWQILQIPTVYAATGSSFNVRWM